MSEKEHDQDADLWDPLQAQKILMPCDGACRLIRACFMSDWEDLQASLDQVRTKNLMETESIVDAINNLKLSEDKGIHPTRENGFKGLKGSERLAALERMEQEDDERDKSLNPEFLSINDQVSSPAGQTMNYSVYYIIWLTDTDCAH